MSEYSDQVTVCNVRDIEENDMKAFDFDDNNRVLVVKQNGRMSAIGAICPHKGGLLHLGVLGKGRIRCPLHGGCYDIKTGDIEDYPGMDSLPCYQISIGGEGEVRVRARLQDLNKVGRVKEMVPRESADTRCFVTVGGGIASLTCAETLRQEGFTGRLIMICDENYLPYERIILSKQVDVSIEEMTLRDAAFYRNNGIEVLTGLAATHLDTELKRIHCSNKSWIKYDKIFIATGGRTHKPPIKGIDLRNIFGLHTYNEYLEMRALLNEDTNLVLLGSGFIALELSSLQFDRVNSITIIDHSNFPLSNAYGEEVGTVFMNLLSDHGIQLEMNNGITEIIGNSEGKVAGILTSTGKIIKCDVLVLSAGVKLNTEFLADSKLNVNPNGSIDTDMHLMTNIPEVYVGGDIANAPVLTNSNQRMTVGHYHLAQYHGRVAGLNMADIIEDLRVVPYFDTTLFGKNLKQAGFGHKHEVYTVGNLESFQFTAYLFDEDGNVLAVATCGDGRLSIQFAELNSQGKRLHRSHVVDKENPVEWTSMLQDNIIARCVC